MSKNVIMGIIVGILVVLGGAGVFIVLQNNQARVTNVSTGQAQEVKTGKAAFVAVDACNILTEKIAKEILGDGAEKGNTAGGNASTSDVSVSNCTYTVKIDPNATGVNNHKGVSVLVRAAKSDKGASSNKAQFDSSKPEGVQDVSGYGEKAYYNPKYGQLNVLKNNNWYIVTGYSGSVSTGASLELDKQLADKLHFK